MQIARHVQQIEAVGRTQREQQAVFQRRGLQLEVELPTEALAQRKPEGAVDPRPERAVDDQMRIADLVEKALEDQMIVRRQRAQRGMRRAQVLRELIGRRQGKPIILRQVRARRVDAAGGERRLHGGIEIRHRLGQGVAAPRRLAQPERNARRRLAGVTDLHPIGFHAQDAVGAIAELEDVAGQALEGEILVHRADAHAFGLQNDVVVELIGNGAAVEQGAQARAAAGPQDAGGRVVKQMRAAPPAPGVHALGQKRDELIEHRPLERPVGPSRRDLRPQRGLGDFAAPGHLGHHLLGQHVQRPGRDHQPVERARADGVQQGRAFEQIIPAEREQPTLGRAPHAVAGTPDPLQEGIDAAR